MDENKRSTILNAASLEEMGTFWDSQDFTDYDTDAPDVSFTFPRGVHIEARLLSALQQQAQLRGVTIETLVNLWLQQKLAEEVRPAA